MSIINVALKDNEIVTIDEVERGLACGCVCINCHAMLMARKGDEREHHFAHHGSQETMACYESAFRMATREALQQTSEIKLPIKRTIEGNKIVSDEFLFKYSDVKILNSVRNSSKGLEILVELKNENKGVLDVLICTSNKSRRCTGAETFRENVSRVRINLVNVKALTFDEFRRYLAYDTHSKEWIYNKKTDDKTRKNINDEKVEAVSKIAGNLQAHKVEFTNNNLYRDYKDVLHLNSVPNNQINKDKIITSNRTPEENQKLGREIWEKKFKGKR